MNPEREVQMLEDLPKVAIMEDEESNIHMRNLSIHRANNEEEALNLVCSHLRQCSSTPERVAPCTIKRHCTRDIAVQDKQSLIDAGTVLLTVSMHFQTYRRYYEVVRQPLGQKDLQSYRNGVMFTATHLTMCN